MEEVMSQQSPSETIWWFLGTDTDQAWHERRIRAPDRETAVSWWTERTGRAPDVAWSARETLLRIDEGKQKLAEWPSLPGESPANWFLGWLGNAQGQMTLVAVPAADEERAFIVLASEQPDCSIRILGDVSALDQVREDLAHALEIPSAVDIDLFPKKSHTMPADLVAWLDQQFDMEPNP
jgi:hypothetical protein